MRLTINRGDAIARDLTPGYVSNWLPFTTDVDQDLIKRMDAARMDYEVARNASDSYEWPKGATGQAWQDALNEARELSVACQAAWQAFGEVRREFGHQVVRNIVRDCTVCGKEATPDCTVQNKGRAICADCFSVNV